MAISVSLFWEQIRGLFPRNRFNALVDELREAGRRIDFVAEYGPINDEEQVLTIQRKLNRLGIATPPLTDYRRWLLFLARAASLAQTKDLKEARRLEENG